MTTTETAEFALDANEIDAINIARTTLARIAKRAGSASWNVAPGDGEYIGTALHQAANLGAVREAAETAEQILFGVLNLANSHLHLGLTEEQLHNRSEDA